MTSFMGTVRTEVAVGMDSDCSMFLAVRIGAPLSFSVLGSATVCDGALCTASGVREVRDDAAALMVLAFFLLTVAEVGEGGLADGAGSLVPEPSCGA